MHAHTWAAGCMCWIALAALCGHATHSPYDLQIVRHLLLHHFRQCPAPAVVFVVDCSDRDRMSQAQEELHFLLDHVRRSAGSAGRAQQGWRNAQSALLHRATDVEGGPAHISSPPARTQRTNVQQDNHAGAWTVQEELSGDEKLLVLANKQDLPHAMGAGELAGVLGLPALRQRCWCVLRNRGRREGVCCAAPAGGDLRW